MDKVIRVATFQPCRCEATNFGSAQHCSVVIRDTAVRDAEAVAISYAWGEHQQEEFCIGHRADNARDLLFLTLGAEWSRTSFRNRLIQLSDENGGCWIDQICVPQKDAEVRATLATIPIIYRSLPVVVILPGSLCSCINNAFADWCAVRKGNPKTEQRMCAQRKDMAARRPQAVTRSSSDLGLTESRLYMAMVGHNCFNASGCCSWTDRLWAFQELSYATNLRLLFADEAQAECVELSENQPSISSERITGYMNCLYQDLRAKELRHEQIVRQVRARGQSFFAKFVSFCKGNEFLHSGLVRETWHNIHNGSTSMHSSGSSPNPYSQREVFCRLMLGETVHLGVRNWNERGIGHQRRCQTLATQVLTATQERDYILSVWTDQAFYKIPENAKSLSTFDLLADVFRQMQQDDSAMDGYHPTTWAAGLFGASEGTARYDLNNDFQCHSVTDSRDIYGPFSWDCVDVFDTKVFGKGVPIRLHSSERSEDQLFSYSEVVGNISTQNQGLLSRFIYLFGSRPEEAPVKVNSMFQYIECDEGRPFVYGGDSNDGCIPSDADDGDLESAVYRHCCKKFRLDENFCRTHEIQLVFKERRLPVPQSDCPKRLLRQSVTCIGLINQPQLDKARSAGFSSISVSLGNKPDVPFYEAVPIDWNYTKFAVIGVWLPLQQDLQCDDIEAVVTNDGYNAVLV